jgi:ABC-type lipoprotein release transport system permease subunit
VSLLAVAMTGLDAATRRPSRSVACVLCVVAVLAPYLAGLGVSRGVADQALESVSVGADVYVTGERFGRTVPVPLAAVDAVRAVPGVTDVVPRIVASIHLGRDRESAVLVGLPAARFPSNVTCVDGRLPAAGPRNELAFGSRLARRLGLSAGSSIPPFYRNDEGERVSTVVGVFRSDLPIWEANLVLTDFDTAARISASRGLASGFLVSCAPQYLASVRTAILRIDSLAPGDPQGPIRPRVIGRDDAEALVPLGVLDREGVFHLHFVLLIAATIPLLLVTSGVGLAERRRDTGILKALGWQTDEVLVRGLAESFALATFGAALSVLIAYAWLRGLNGWGVAGVFLSGVDAAPGFEVPFHLAGTPVVVATALAFVVTSTGTLVSTWRAASAPPAEAMK